MATVDRHGIDPPEDACAWHCGTPVTADQYRLGPRSLVILILPEINRISTATERPPFTTLSPSANIDYRPTPGQGRENHEQGK